MSTDQVIDRTRKVFMQIGHFYFVIMVFWILIALSEQNHGSFSNGQAYKLDVYDMRQFVTAFMVLVVICEVVWKLISHGYVPENTRKKIVGELIPYILWSISFIIFFNFAFGLLFVWYIYNQSNTINLLFFLSASAGINLIINFALSITVKLLKKKTANSEMFD